MKYKKIIIFSLLIVILYFVLKMRNIKENFDNDDDNNNKINNILSKFPIMTNIQDIELKKLLKIMHNNFIKNKIDYCMCGGTLLGSIRHKDKIPWDDDADVFLLEENEKNVEKINWEDFGCKLHKHWIGYKLCFTEGKKAVENNQEMEWNYPFVDIFVSKYFDDKITYKNEQCRNFWPKDYIYKQELFPLKLYKFGDLYLYGPNKPYDYINRYFGDYWHTDAEMNSSHILGHKLDKVEFKINDYNKINNIKKINYMWVFNCEKIQEDKIIEQFCNDYVIIFINSKNINKYCPEITEKIDVYNYDSFVNIKKNLKEKYGGEFLFIE